MNNNPWVPRKPTNKPILQKIPETMPRAIPSNLVHSGSLVER